MSNLLNPQRLSNSINRPNLKVWLDPSDTSTITSSSNSLIEWRDKKGNFVASQSESLAQPKTGTLLLNGLNVIDFYNVNTLTTNFQFENTKSYTIYIISDHIPDLPIAGYMLSQTGNGINRVMFLGHDESDNYTAGFGASTISSSQPAGSARICKFEFKLGENPNNVLTVNEIITTGNITPEDEGTETMYIGSKRGVSNFWNGLIAEILIYDEILDSTQNEETLNYLTNKWGVT